MSHVTTQKMPGIHRCWIFLGMMLFLASHAALLTAQERWVPADNSLTINHLNKIHFDGDQFLAVGDAGEMLTSKDGTNWTNLPPMTRRPLAMIRPLGEEKTLVAGWVRDEFSLLSLPNGADLLLLPRVSDPSSLGIQRVEYDLRLNRILAATAADNQFTILGQVNEGFGSTTYQLTSSDLNSWSSTVVTENISHASHVTDWKNAFWMVNPTSGDLKKSQDGLNWQTHKAAALSLSNSERILMFKSTGSHLVAATDKKNVWFSLDGTRWDSSSITIPNVTQINDIHSADGKYVLVSDNNSILRSDNLIHWVFTSEELPDKNWNSVTYGNGLWVAVGDNGAIATSSNANSWHFVAGENYQPELSYLHAITSTPTSLIAINNEKIWMESQDLQSWTRHDLKVPLSPVALYKSGTMRIASGRVRRLAHSHSGLPFEIVKSPVSSDIIAFAGSESTGAIIGLSKDGELIHLDDPTDWKQVALPNIRVRDINHDGNQFILVGTDMTDQRVVIMNSSDGVQWDRSTITSSTSNVEMLTGIFSANGTVLAWGQTRPVSTKGHRLSPPVFRSMDGGMTFSSASLNFPNHFIESMSYLDDRFLAFCRGGIVIQSEDGSSWELATESNLTNQTFTSARSNKAGSLILTDHGNALVYSKPASVNQEKPSALDDAISVTFWENQILDLLENDSESAVPTSLEIMKHPNFGSLSISSMDGSVTYSHDGLHLQSDHFQYRVADSHGIYSNVATVTITFNEDSSKIFHHPNEDFRKGGQLAEWPEDHIAARDMRDYFPPPFIHGYDYQSLYLSHSIELLHIGIQNHITSPLTWANNIYIDSDNLQESGYQFKKMGADFLLQGSSFYKYAGNGDSWSWVYLFDVASTFTESRYELDIPRIAIGYSNLIGISVFGANARYHGDEYPVPDDFIPDSDHPILYSLKLDSDNTIPQGMNSQTATLTDNPTAFTVKFTDPDNQTHSLILESMPSNGSLRLTADPDIPLDANSQIQLPSHSRSIEFDFVPDAGFSGINFVRWKISDRDSESPSFATRILVYDYGDSGYPEFPALNLRVDGMTSDWSGIPSLIRDKAEPSIDSDSPNWIDISLASSPLELFIKARIQSPAPLSWHYNFYLDSDDSEVTGYRGPDNRFASGAEYLLQGRNIFHYVGDGTSWEWQFLDTAHHAISASGTSHEWAIPLSLINHPDQIRVLAKSESPQSGIHDFAPDQPEVEYLSFTISSFSSLNTGRGSDKINPIDVRTTSTYHFRIIPSLPIARSSQFDHQISAPVLNHVTDAFLGDWIEVHYSSDLINWHHLQSLKAEFQNDFIYLPEQADNKSGFFHFRQN